MIAGFENDLGGARTMDLDEVMAARLEIFLNIGGKRFSSSARSGENQFAATT